ncbi:MAG: hypothetical protein GY874_01915 [Desulfobacteraceae bacterium]|nr:hypothetical protein [Desulfobacteraceae bacterium]
MALKKATNFLEELSWLLDSRKGIDLKQVVSFLQESVKEQNKIKKFAKEYRSPNPNKHFLIGVLPRLFQDTRLFPLNESIAMFAEEVLEINISRHEKRSKYELIGLIVCKTESLSDEKLSNLVDALSQITGSEEKLEKFRQERKQVDFSWNETIQKLTK